MDIRYDRSRYFEFPKLFYFEAGNPAVISRNSYNFRVLPVKGENGMEFDISVWYGLKCFELSEVLYHEKFPLDDAGYREMIYWNDELYDVYTEKLAAGEVEGRRTYTERR